MIRIRAILEKSSGVLADLQADCDAREEAGLHGFVGRERDLCGWVNWGASAGHRRGATQSLPPRSPIDPRWC